MALHKRVLIANRGEIAIRIAKAASALGMESVGVYALADALSLHTRFTTESREIAPHGEETDPVRAYLDAEALVRIAMASGCDCVHPGYGFLAENAAFAERCASAGLVFVGPLPATLSLFGDKLRARALAQSLEIPIVPGSAEALRSSTEASAQAGDLGYPVMLKASAGGGGRGMRQVENAEQLAEGFARCRSEAEAAFRDGSVFVEKLIARPRHIEVQILADAHGDVVHLHERRLLGAAPKPEGGGNRPCPRTGPRSPGTDPRGRDQARAGIEIHQCRNHGVLGLSGNRRTLLHRMQPANPGGAHRH